MRFGDQQSLRKYEKFRDDIFGAKKQQYKQNIRKTNSQRQPIKTKPENIVKPYAFIKRLGIVSSFGAIAYMLYHYKLYPDFGQLNLFHNFNVFAPQLKYSLKALRNDFSRRVSNQVSLNSAEQKYFANREFNRYLSQDLQYIKKKSQSRLISKETKSRWGIGSLKFGVSEQSLGINQKGYLLKVTKSCAVKIDSLCIGGRKRYSVVDRQKRLSQYLDTIRQDDVDLKFGIRQHCSTANLINKLYLVPYEHELVVDKCIQQSWQTLSRIKREVIKRQRKFNPGAFNGNQQDSGKIFLFS